MTQRVYQELPLRDYEGIVNANALCIDWNDVVPADEVDYILGNPPFIGNARLEDSQKEDRANIFGKSAGSLDYVACWHKTASEYMAGHHIRCAFVSTNSICQGQQVEPLWKPLFENGVHIDFAYPTFEWDSQASDEAHVHVIIVGFSREHIKEKVLFDREGTPKVVGNINGYLAPIKDMFVSRRSRPLCDVLPMVRGCQPTDDGNLLLSAEERDALVAREPEAEGLIRPFSMGAEYIKGTSRYCLWMDGIDPAVLTKMPITRERVQRVREFRLTSTKEATRLRKRVTLPSPLCPRAGGSMSQRVL